jgi:catechol 2,3-dioxygenase-like lactoylglutathione lyase family enzyme
VRTSNPDQAVALYSQALGLRLALDTSAHGPRMLFFRVGGVTLEVIEDPGIGEQDVFYGLCYRVPDLDAAHRRLTRMGFSVGEPRDGKKPGTRVFTVRNRTAGVPTLVLHDPARGD